MTVKELYDSKEEIREELGRLIKRARRESLSRGKPSWRIRNRITSELARLRQLERDLSQQLSYRKTIGFEL